MLLIAESGSTKTDWRLVNKGEIVPFKTIGFNPYHIQEKEIVQHLKQSELAEKAKEVTQLYFYGSGCATDENKQLIKIALEQVFTSAKINVDHDLMAAARACCGKEKGMVAILGTGSNTCLYDGVNITHNIPALGYVLGDEGSGTYMGKELIKKYLNKELSPHLNEAFEKKYPYRLNSILNQVYKQPLPNEFLAQFTRFLKEHEQEEEIREIIQNSFHSFFTQHICKYPSYQQYDLNLVGSIAHVFNKQLKAVAQNYEVTINKVAERPINELVRFHTI